MFIYSMIFQKKKKRKQDPVFDHGICSIFLLVTSVSHFDTLNLYAASVSGPQRELGFAWWQFSLQAVLKNRLLIFSLLLKLHTS